MVDNCQSLPLSSIQPYRVFPSTHFIQKKKSQRGHRHAPIVNRSANLRNNNILHGRYGYCEHAKKNLETIALSNWFERSIKSKSVERVVHQGLRQQWRTPGYERSPQQSRTNLRRILLLLPPVYSAGPCLLYLSLLLRVIERIMPFNKTRDSRIERRSSLFSFCRSLLFVIIFLINTTRTPTQWSRLYSETNESIVGGIVRSYR